MRERWLAIPAGIFFAADLVFWHYAIARRRRRPRDRARQPPGGRRRRSSPGWSWASGSRRGCWPRCRSCCSGVVLISGVLETGAYGDDPLRGVIFGVLTGAHLRGVHPRPAPGRLRPAPPGGPAVRRHAGRHGGGGVAGLAIGEVDLVPAWPAHGWLVVLALTSQVLGWLLITVSLPRLPGRADLGHADDPARRVGAAGRDPARRGAGALQLAGVACILAGLVSVALRRDPTRRPVPEPA